VAAPKADPPEGHPARLKVLPLLLRVVRPGKAPVSRALARDTPVCIAATLSHRLSISPPLASAQSTKSAEAGAAGDKTASRKRDSGTIDTFV
jgi:hypothetical protein